MKDVVGKGSGSCLQGPPTLIAPRRTASPRWSPGAMEMEGAAASSRFPQPHMERKMSAMTCEIFNELRLEGKLCDVVIKVNGFEFNAHKNILCSCSSYFRCGLPPSPGGQGLWPPPLSRAQLASGGGGLRSLTQVPAQTPEET